MEKCSIQTIWTWIWCETRGGGVISPTLFAVYMNDLIVKIQNSKSGCHINRVPMSIFADDLVLVASSLIHWRITIEICQCELDEIDRKLNVLKTQCIVILVMIIAKYCKQI